MASQIGVLYKQDISDAEIGYLITPPFRWLILVSWDNLLGFPRRRLTLSDQGAAHPTNACGIGLLYVHQSSSILPGVPSSLSGRDRPEMGDKPPSKGPTKRKIPWWWFCLSSPVMSVQLNRKISIDSCPEVCSYFVLQSSAERYVLRMHGAAHINAAPQFNDL